MTAHSSTEDWKDLVQGSVTLRHRQGLHARASVGFTRLANTFSAQTLVGLTATGPWVDAKSIVKVLKLKTPPDSQLFIQAAGDDAQSAVAALIRFIEVDLPKTEATAVEND
jgi:phosphocarrier protein HPr